MAPPTEAFPASELPYRVQITAQGKRRKGGDIDLRKCELLELVQYDCRVDQRQAKAPVKCYPIVRLFRRYGKASGISFNYIVTSSRLES